MFESYKSYYFGTQSCSCSKYIINFTANQYASRYGFLSNSVYLLEPKNEQLNCFEERVNLLQVWNIYLCDMSISILEKVNNPTILNEGKDSPSEYISKFSFGLDFYIIDDKTDLSINNQANKINKLFSLYPSSITLG